MPRQKTKDAERVRFITPPGTSNLYAEIAELEGVRTDAWIRNTLYKEATRVLEAHGRDTSAMPPAHLKRPPRLQPRYGEEDGDAGSKKPVKKKPVKKKPVKKKAAKKSAR